jgi:V8-like Glu-specific endopeptidase
MKFILISLVTFNLYASVERTNIVYGDDNRQDIERITNAAIKELSNSIAVRVSKPNLYNLGLFYTLKSKYQLDDIFGIPMCKGEKFSSQPSVADCTGFLIGEDTLVTAGHCMLDFDGEETNKATAACQDNYWMFDYKYQDNRLDLDYIPESNIYSCKSVRKVVLNSTVDYAVITLDRKVVGRKGLKIRKYGKVKTNESIFVIGAPSGLPLKYAGDAKVSSNSEDAYFATNLDTFGGNSGSPVFNASTLEVEGILVRGRTDYVQYSSAHGSCIKVNKCDQRGKNCVQPDDGTDLDGEHVFRINSMSL